MGRGRTQATLAEGIADAVVFAILLFFALLVLSLIFPGFRVVFGIGNSFLFALAYFVARILYTPVAAALSSLFGR